MSRYPPRRVTFWMNRCCVQERIYFARLLALAIGNQFVRFCLAGTVVTAIHFMSLIFFVESLGMQPTVASTAAFIVAVTLSYVLNSKFVFGTAGDVLIRGPRFLLVSLIGMGLNTSIMYVLTSVYGLYYLLSQVFATGGVLFWNFNVNRFWTFRPVLHQVKGEDSID